MPDSRGNFKGISVPALPWHTLGCTCGWTGGDWNSASKHVITMINQGRGEHKVERIGYETLRCPMMHSFWPDCQGRLVCAVCGIIVPDRLCDQAHTTEPPDVS